MNRKVRLKFKNVKKIYNTDLKTYVNIVSNR